MTANLKPIMLIVLIFSILFVGSSCLFFHKVDSQTRQQPVDYVDVFIGTSNSRWMLGPYATMPFGMVQLGPDNQGHGWMTGYEYAINSVMGFSHLHAWTMGGLRLMPTTIDLVTCDRSTDAPYKGANAGYHSRIQKETEKASPGYYEVYLYDHDVLAQMAVTSRCGFHRYTFPERKAPKESRILIDLQFDSEYGYKITDATITKVSDKEIEGYAASAVGYGDWRWNDYTLYFVIRFDKPYKKMNGWNRYEDKDGKRKEEEKDDVNELSGKEDIGVYVTYETEENEVVQLQSGISLVSIEQARLNLDTEMGPFNWNFEAAKKNARDTWNELLGRIKVEGGTEKDKTKFYTNLYRAYSAKQTWNDVDGKYRDPGETIRKLKPGQAIYGGDAFWNSYWNLNGLWSLISPEIVDNWVTTQLELFKHTGWTSKGPSGIEYSGIMVGNHEIALMVSSYQRGIRKDGEAIYKAIKKNVTENRGGNTYNGLPGNGELDIYKKYGYIPHELGYTSNALDYCFDDWCVAQMAMALGKKDDYNLLSKRSMNYKNIFHPDLKYFVPKDALGNWKPDFDEFSNKGFIEGNSWQYTWYVPHDIEGLIELMGRDYFNNRLETGFERSVKEKFAAHACDRTWGQRAEYYINHGNQVNMQAAWLFNYSGKPWLTQKYTRAIMDSYYGDTPYHGWEGDEDEGQMGAWYIMSALGFFEMDGGCSQDSKVEIGSCLFEKITIRLDNNYYKGKEFIIEARNNSKENIYIQSAKLNGLPLKSPFIKFKNIVDGGKLELEMGPEPNKEWGKSL